MACDGCGLAAADCRAMLAAGHGACCQLCHIIDQHDSGGALS